MAFGLLLRVIGLSGMLSLAFPAPPARGAGLGAGEDHLLFLREDGALWGLGDASHGQLGFGIGETQALPVRIDTGIWVKVAAGPQYSLGIRADGSLWAFGRNHAAQLGKSHRFAVVKPKRVGKNRWLDVAAGSTATLAVREDSSLRIWGGWTKVPQRKDLAGVQGLSRLVTVGKWRSVAMGADHGLALRADGALFALGADGAGQSGCGERPAYIQVCKVQGGPWLAMATGDRFSLGLRADSTLWSWGTNTFGELGRGSESPAEGTGQVGGERWLAVAAGGSHVLALRADSTLWAWGAGEDGALGSGSLDNQAAPVQVGAGRDKWLALAAGRRFSVGLRTDGNFLVWGNLAFADGPPAPGRSALVLHPTPVDRRLAFPPLQPATVGESPRSVALEGFRGDSLVLISANPEVATIEGESLRFLAPGTADIEVWAVPRPGWNRKGNLPDTLRTLRTLEVAAVPAPAVATASLPPPALSLPSPVKPAPAANPLRDSRTWVPSRQALLWAGGGALIAGGTVWAWLTFFGAEKSQPPELGLPPGDPVLQGALP